MGGFGERPRQSIILFSETRLFHVPEGAGEIPDKMIQPALADSMPTLVELVSTHAGAAGIDYRRGSERNTLVFTLTPDRRGKK
jgi:hypothetical protein